ncbi:AAA family ATPase [Flavobacterium sp. XGLA_31]|uniref:AAA family ATPase n=1 Tax=Flavobacterium sp. XGLA_31 TaxID=3447666 RepID=UPI003F2E9D72
MSGTPLKNQIISWLKTNPYWLQYAGNSILEIGVITHDLLDKTYDYFKEDNGLKPIEETRAEITFNEIQTDAAAVSQTIALRAIKDISHVNALAAGQSISIGDNLTVIYGGNGAGKSGYVRMLNNAFDSRGDKNILGNVYVAGVSGAPSCTFTFDDGSAQTDLVYPANGNDPAFHKFAIFDTQSVRVHLEGDNKLNFTPIGFEFFELLDIFYNALKDKLVTEIATNKPVNSYPDSFTSDNLVKQTLSGLSASTDEEALKKIAGLSQKEGELFTELVAKQKQLKDLDIPKKVSGLQDLKTAFNDYISKQQTVLDRIKQDNIEQYTALLKDHAKFLELTKQEGITAFQQYNIAEIGSPEWQAFVKASRVYADKIENSRDGAHYPSQEDACLLCLRPLGDDERKLFETYWNLLKSEAGRELQRIEAEISETVQALSGLAVPVFDETTTYYNNVLGTNPELAKKWKEISETAELLKKNVIANLSNRNLALPMQSFAFNTDELMPSVMLIYSEIGTLLQSNPAQELADLEKQIALLGDRHMMGRMMKGILELVASYKWAAKAETTVAALNTASITKEQGRLFGLHITDKYTNLFNDECEKLRAPKVVSIVQKNAKISSFRKLQINGAAANSVLSEGEQRAISLADFLTEAQLNPNNKGLFFDDPVTSQDHIRKEYIASRLVDLAQAKQVVVLTHDIGFFIRLQIASEEAGVNCLVTTMRNVHGTPGIIRPDLPWIAQKVGDRVKTLRDRLVRLKVLEKAGDDDEYLIAVKSWYGLLREGWERAVEERLFKGVVERFGLGVQTQKLKKVVITPELLADIEKGMTDTSNWAHDAAAARDIPPPDTTQAQADLDFLDAFTKKCPAA